MAGYPHDANATNIRAAGVAAALRNAFIEVDKLQNDFLGQYANKAALMTDTGLTDADATTIMAAALAMESLRKIALGINGGQTSANNYLFDAKKLIGPN
jgi:hypothetical protein